MPAADFEQMRAEAEAQVGRSVATPTWPRG